MKYYRAFSIPLTKHHIKFINEVYSIFDAIELPFKTEVEEGHQESDVVFMTPSVFTSLAEKFVARISKERDSQKLRVSFINELKATKVLYGKN